LKLDIPKVEQTGDWGAPALSGEQIAYAAADSVLVFRLWPLLIDALKNKKRFDAYQLQRNVIPATVDMTLRGFALDLQEHARHAQRWSDELAQAKADFINVTGLPVATTPREIGAYLEKVLTPEQLKNWPHTPKAKTLSTQRSDLERFAMQPAIRALITVQALEKLHSNFGRRLREKVHEGRVYANFNIAGAKTGRFSARTPNMQQLPSKRDPTFKSCFVAAPGRVLVGCDFNQLEMRAAAWISGDPVMTAIFADESRDIHSENAAAIAGIPLAEVTPAQRSAAKPIGFGLLFGMGPTKLAVHAWTNYGVDMSVADATIARQRLLAALQRLRMWQRQQGDECRAYGRIRIGCGRVIEAAWEPGSELLYSLCLNAPIQGASADCAMRALINVRRALAAAEIAGGLVGFIHDELILEVLEPDAERAKEILQTAMTKAFATTFPGAPLSKVATAKIGANWAAVK
jgi:DNA polymerase I